MPRVARPAPRVADCCARQAPSDAQHRARPAPIVAQRRARPAPIVARPAPGVAQRRARPVHIVAHVARTRRPGRAHPAPSVAHASRAQRPSVARLPAHRLASRAARVMTSSKNKKWSFPVSSIFSFKRPIGKGGMPASRGPCLGAVLRLSYWPCCANAQLRRSPVPLRRASVRRRSWHRAGQRARAARPFGWPSHAAAHWALMTSSKNKMWSFPVSSNFSFKRPIGKAKLPSTGRGEGRQTGARSACVRAFVVGFCVPYGARSGRSCCGRRPFRLLTVGGCVGTVRVVTVRGWHSARLGRTDHGPER